MDQERGDRAHVGLVGRALEHLLERRGEPRRPGDLLARRRVGHERVARPRARARDRAARTPRLPSAAAARRDGCRAAASAACGAAASRRSARCRVPRAARRSRRRSTSSRTRRRPFHAVSRGDGVWPWKRARPVHHDTVMSLRVQVEQVVEQRVARHHARAVARQRLADQRQRGIDDPAARRSVTDQTRRADGRGTARRAAPPRARARRASSTSAGGAHDQRRQHAASRASSTATSSTVAASSSVSQRSTSASGIGAPTWSSPPATSGRTNALEETSADVGRSAIRRARSSPDGKQLAIRRVGEAPEREPPDRVVDDLDVSGDGSAREVLDGSARSTVELARASGARASANAALGAAGTAGCRA